MECREAERNVQKYIAGKLSDRECAAFIAHVRGCSSCYDELETYFTIDYALRPGEEDTAGKSFDMKRVIEANLSDTEDRLRRARTAGRFMNAFTLIAEAGLLVVAFCKFMPDTMSSILGWLADFLAKYI